MDETVACCCSTTSSSEEENVEAIDEMDKPPAVRREHERKRGERPEEEEVHCAVDCDQPEDDLVPQRTSPGGQFDLASVGWKTPPDTRRRR